MAYYCTGKLGENDKIVSFINEVFQEEFYDIMKKTYAPGQHFECFHHLVKEQDEIVAALGVYEQLFHCKDDSIEPLKTGFIGSVSVSKKERKKGYMKLLMEKAEEQMRADGVAFAMLGGLRNRYGHWGYEYGGLYYQCHFSWENIHHTIGWQDDFGVAIRQVDKDKMSSFDFEQALNRIYELYRQNTMWCRSRDDFYLCSLTWNHRLFELIVDGSFAGYMVCNQDGGFLPEFDLVCWEKPYVLRVIGALMRHNPKENGCNIHGLTIQTHLWEPKKSIVLQQICEHVMMHNRCNMKILDYPKTLQFMLQLKKSYHKNHVAEGRFIVSVKEKGTFVMEVKSDLVSVWQDDLAIADLVVSEQECISALMSTVSPLYEHQTPNGYPKGWFPLEFAPGNLDEF